MHNTFNTIHSYLQILLIHLTHICIKKSYLCYYIIILIIILYHCLAYTITYSLPENHNRLIGKNINFTVPKNNVFSLEYFSSKFQIGLKNILAVNPNVDIYLPDSETKLIIPYQLILPDTPHIGIIINIAEMRLYYYPEKSNTVIVLPIAIGTIENATPSNWITSIKDKKKTQFGFLLKKCTENI